MKTCRLQYKALSLSLAALFAVAGMFALCASPRPAAAQGAQEIYYCDTYYTGANYGGGGLREDGEYIYRDSYTVGENYRVAQAPSYGSDNQSVQNYCAVSAGRNIVVYYDRAFPDLIPGFEPGVSAGGQYIYLPDLGYEETEEVFDILYDEMKTNVGGAGTSGTNFKNGLKTYAQDRGYSLSYSSFYEDRENVDLAAFEDAIDAGKVGVLLLTKYNFIYSIDHGSGSTYLDRWISDIAHIMMVYGYITVRYYDNGSLIGTDTFLQASSGFNTADQGYIRMDDYLQIEEALIVNVS